MLILQASQMDRVESDLVAIPHAANVNRDVTRILLECFPGRECKTLEEFEQRMTEFQRRSGTCYARRRSVTAETYRKTTGKVIPAELGYALMVYQCVHAAADWKANVRGRR